jgi:broad specificity phosphatase PhoE
MFRFLNAASKSSVMMVAIGGVTTSCLAEKHSVNRLHKDDKIVHFVRHAEGYHNLAAKNDPKYGYLRADLIDASITKYGISQCQDLHLSSKDKMSKAELLVVSPMHRTIQTANHTFPQLQTSIPWLALEAVREQTGSHPCDKRQPISSHKQTYKHINFDGILHDHDPLYDKYTEREPEDDVVIRCNEFLEWLGTRKEKEIIVVTHSAYLRHLFNSVLHTEAPYDKTTFANCEMRSYVLRFPGSMEERVVQETEEVH